jgi:chloramphenicol-sensitive protein RarD
MNKGLLFAAGAYALWGFLPIYWKWLGDLPAVEILSHRVVWALVFVAVLQIPTRNHWRGIRRTLRDRRALLAYSAAAAFLGVNWLTYIWAINANFVVETSLGYFINPLLNVLLGFLLLGERLRRGQWLAVGIAAAGVIYLTVEYGRPPWIALALATTFGLYGLLKKKAALNALDGLTMETAIMFLPAFVYLIAVEGGRGGAFVHAGPVTTLLLVMAGAVTAIPLLLFAAGARRIQLSTLGILQYIAPSLQFLLGVFMFGEPFPLSRLIGFSIIWFALLVYTSEGIHNYRQQRQQEPAAPGTATAERRSSHV